MKEVTYEEWQKNPTPFGAILQKKRKKAPFFIKKMTIKA